MCFAERPNFRSLPSNPLPCHLPRVGAPKEFSAMVLSAGFGTRLRPLTDEIPKPLVPIGDRPLLGISLQKLREAGARELIVNVHHHAEKIEKYISELSFSVHVSREERILGTAGGIAAARRFFSGGPLLIVNGDIVGELPVESLLNASDRGLVMALTRGRVGEGTVGVDADGNVVRLRGECFGQEIAAGDYMGIAVLGSDCLATLPNEGCLVGDWALPRLREGAKLRTLTVGERFEDVGTPRAYLSANLRWLSQQMGGPAHSYLGTDVSVSEGVEVIASLVGAGARIMGTGQVEASLILPGAQARAPLSNVIVTPSGCVIFAGEDQE